MRRKTFSKPSLYVRAVPRLGRRTATHVLVVGREEAQLVDLRIAEHERHQLESVEDVVVRGRCLSPGPSSATRRWRSATPARSASCAASPQSGRPRCRRARSRPPNGHEPRLEARAPHATRRGRGRRRRRAATGARSRRLTAALPARRCSASSAATAGGCPTGRPGHRSRRRAGDGGAAILTARSRTPRTVARHACQISELATAEPNCAGYMIHAFQASRVVDVMADPARNG